MAFRKGHLLNDRYEIVNPLGTGGMGEVYRALDKKLNREVALKVIPQDLAKEPSRRKRFEQEAKTVAALQHPNIMSLFDIREDDGLLYLVTELVEGSTLRDITLRFPKILDVASQAAEALGFAHSKKVIHLDIKPTNIMVTHDGQVKILDFGIAKTSKLDNFNSRTTETLTDPGTVIGTLAYMSPEQVKGQKVDYRSDIFSLGVVLYEMLVGRCPFEGSSQRAVIDAILNQEILDLPEQPRNLAAIVLRCIEKDVARRFQSAADLAFAIRLVLSDIRSLRHGPSTYTTPGRRGDTLPNIIDSSFLTETLVPSFESKVLSEMRSGSMLSCEHSYQTETGARHWLKLCNDPLYTVFHDSVRLLEQQCDAILDCISEDMIRKSPDVISLGPGNGQKDRVLLRGILKRLQAAGASPYLYYFPFDVSPHIIASSVTTIFSDQKLNAFVRLKALVGDFSHLQEFRPIYDFRDAPNIFALLGNTLGNMSQEVIFLQQIKRAMNSGDILLLEVRRNIGHLKAGGQDEDQFGLSFAPLAQLGVKYDGGKILVREESALSQVPGTKTLAVHYSDALIGGERYEDIFLSCVNYYDETALRRTVEGTTLNFEILSVMEGDLVISFVLRRR